MYGVSQYTGYISSFVHIALLSMRFVDDGDSFESLVRVLKLHILIAGTVLHILSLVYQTDYIKVEHIINRET